MLAVALVAFVANAVSLYLLRDAQERSLNMRGAYLEVMGDLLGALSVIVASVVIGPPVVPTGSSISTVWLDSGSRGTIISGTVSPGWLN